MTDAKPTKSSLNGATLAYMAIDQLPEGLTPRQQWDHFGAIEDDQADMGLLSEEEARRYEDTLRAKGYDLDTLFHG